MPRNLPPLNALRAFEAAGRHGSFTGAADELNVSHSAISRHVRGLEKRLSVQLFRAHSRGVCLTDDGQRYLAALTPAFDEIAAATENFHSDVKGKVTVNSDPSYAERWLIPRIGAFHAMHPGIDVKLVASNKLANLDQHEADIALRFFLNFDLNDGATAETELLSDTPIYPYGSPKVWDAGGSARDLLVHKLLVERNGDPWRAWFQKAGLNEDQIPNVPRALDNALSFAAAAAGQGIILANPEVVERDVTDGRLVRCMDIGLRAGSMRLVFSQGSRRRRPVRVFADWLLESAINNRSA